MLRTRAWSSFDLRVWGERGKKRREVDILETKRIVLLLIAFLLIVYGYTTFEWRSEKERIRVIKDYVTDLFGHPLLELADAGSTLEYLVNNASDDVLRERVRLWKGSG